MSSRLVSSWYLSDSIIIVFQLFHRRELLEDFCLYWKIFNWQTRWYQQLWSCWTTISVVTNWLSNYNKRPGETIPAEEEYLTVDYIIILLNSLGKNSGWNSSVMVKSKEEWDEEQEEQIQNKWSLTHMEVIVSCKILNNFLLS